MELMSLNIDRRDPFYCQMQEKTSEDDVKFWVDLESQHLIQMCLVCDNKYDVHAKVEETGDTENDIEDDATAFDPLKQPLTPRPSVMHRSDFLEDISFSFVVNDAIIHLCIARNAFHHASVRKSMNPTRHFLLRGMMARRGTWSNYSSTLSVVQAHELLK